MFDSNNTAVLLASGGMDSTTLAYWLMNKNISFVPLFINYGQHCAKTEYSTLQQVIPRNLKDKIQTIDVSSIYHGSKSRMIKEADLWTDNVVADDLYIPYRNLLFLTIAASYAQTHNLSEVYTAFINSNHAKEIDCSAHFFDSLEKLLADIGSVTIKMPFRNMSKLEVAKIGKELGVPIGATYSCQASSRVACGACPNCVDRLDALRKL